jgi:hypothetical protein
LTKKILYVKIKGDKKMRKSKKFKEEKEKFESNLITVRRLLSVYSEKTVTTALLFKLREIKDLIKDVEELKHISELIICDLPNHKDIFEMLSSVCSIDDNEIISDEESMIKFSELLLELITPEYIKTLLNDYDKKEFKINSYLIGQETIANNAGEEDYSVFLKN